MSDPATDDRELAHRVLDEGSQPAFTQLVERYQPGLRQRAGRALVSNPALARHGDADDLVQQFLLDKLLPPQKRRVMLAPVADGGRPLWPRLCASFDNFLFSLLRGKALPMSQRPVGEGQDEHTPADRSTDPWPDITELVAAQLAAIRKLPPPAQGAVPYGAVLLLSERLVLAGLIADSFAPADGRTIGNQSVREFVEVVAAWTPAEETTPLPPGAVALKAAWEQICHNTGDRPQQAGAAEVAQVLGAARGTNWSQQLLRGRVHLACLVGAAVARELFPNWPPGPFAQAAARGEGAP